MINLMPRRIRRIASALVRPFRGEPFCRQLNDANSQSERLNEPYSSVPFAGLALQKLCTCFDFGSVVDIGSGAGKHAEVFRSVGKKVTAVDFGSSIYFEQRSADYSCITGDFLSVEFPEKYDCAWASHVLEHQPSPGAFIQRIMEIVSPDGIIAITVPPLKHEIVGGHLSLWNAGLLLYNLVVAGLDCRDASVATYGYNISVITKNTLRPEVKLDFDSGDIDRLSEFFPNAAKERFDGRISRCNWD